MSRLTNDMAVDMQISRYKDEKDQSYYGRLLYSGLAHWMRFFTQDYSLDDSKGRSKAYLLKSGTNMLNNMLDVIPQAKTWFFRESQDAEKVIRLLRDRMLAAGELTELQMGAKVSLPDYTVENNGRIKGLADRSPNCKHIGVTRISSNVQQDSYCFDKIDIKEYIQWIYSHAKWSICNEVKNYEFFDVYSKKPPYQSWTNKVVDIEGLHLARITIINGLYEYWLFKLYDGQYYSAPLGNNLSEYKEQRRIVLGLRKMFQHPMEASYKKEKNVVILRLRCYLPLKEESIMETYCWPSRSVSDKLEYIVPNEMWEQIMYMLVSGLGINLKEKLDG